MHESAGSKVTQIVSDYSIRFLLRPYEGFSTQYQGQSGARPLMFSEVSNPSRSPGGTPTDQLVIDGQEGYDPNLLRGLHVPLGARCLIWLPSLLVGDRDARYAWILIWRMRNVRDYRLTDDERSPYHLPKGVNGVNDGNAPADPERVVIVAAYETIWYSPTQPVSVDGHAVRSGRAADLSYAAADVLAPFLPNGNSGSYQQGVLNPAVQTDALLPQWGTYQTDCKGDELLLGLYKPDSSNWDFTVALLDQPIQTLFQSSGAPIYPDMGVHVYVGSGPAPVNGPPA